MIQNLSRNQLRILLAPQTSLIGNYFCDKSVLYTVNVVIFAGGKFRENVDKAFHVGVIFTILLLFPS